MRLHSLSLVRICLRWNRWSSNAELNANMLSKYVKQHIHIRPFNTAFMNCYCIGGALHNPNGMERNSQRSYLLVKVVFFDVVQMDWN